MTSPLQAFTVKCIAKLIGTEEAELAEAVRQHEAKEAPAGGTLAGIDIGVIIMLFETIMPMIMDMIANCNANQSRVNASIRDPGLFQRIMFRRHVNRAIRNGEPRWRTESHEIANIMFANAALATEAEVDEVINECRNYEFGDLT